MCKSVCYCGGHRIISGASGAISLPFETGSLTASKPQGSTAGPPQHWDYKHVLSLPFIWWGLNSGPLACKAVYPTEPFPSLLALKKTLAVLSV